MNHRYSDTLTITHQWLILIAMRTTLSLDEDIYQAARALADASGENLGSIVSTLARKGLKVQESFAIKNGLPVFQVSADARVIPGGLATKLMGEEDR